MKTWHCVDHGDIDIDLKESVDDLMSEYRLLVEALRYVAKNQETMDRFRYKSFLNLVSDSQERAQKILEDINARIGIKHLPAHVRGDEESKNGSEDSG